MFYLFDYDDPEGVDWYAKLLELTKDKDFEEKQRRFFPLETDLPLKTIKRAYEASLEKDDPVSAAEMLLLNADNVKKIFRESPLSLLLNNSFDNNNEILEMAWRNADLYDKETRVIWYLLFAWYLDRKNKITNAQETLNRLFEKELGTLSTNYNYLSANIITFCVPLLYERYKYNIVKIFNHLSNNLVDIISLSIATLLAKSNKPDEAIQIANQIKDDYSKSVIGRLNENVAPFPSALFSAHMLPP